MKGFCPSFVTVEGGQLRKGDRRSSPTRSNSPAVEPQVDPPRAAWGIVVAGVGGTGVVTIGQLLGHGCAPGGQGRHPRRIRHDRHFAKGGAGGDASRSPTTRIDHLRRKGGEGTAELTSSSLRRHRGGPQGHARRAARGRTRMNPQHPPTHATAALIPPSPTWRLPRPGQHPSKRCARPSAPSTYRPSRRARGAALLGDSIGTNPLMLGHAWQMKGWLPLSREASCAPSAERRRGRRNRAFFGARRRWPRMTWRSVEALLADAKASRSSGAPRLSAHHPTGRAAHAYQNTAYAADYRSFVERVRAAEAPLAPPALTDCRGPAALPPDGLQGRVRGRQIAQRPGFTARIAAEFEGDFCSSTTSRHRCCRDTNGRAIGQKRVFGPWLRPLLWGCVI